MTAKIDASSLPELFRDLVREALDHQKRKAPEGVEFYLVNLLQECLKTDRLHEEPLALLYCRAIQADRAQQIDLLKRLGDLSLYTSGFFSASLARQLVDLNYYVQMGESAYASLSDLTYHKKPVAEIFDELARHFVAYTDILTEVSEKSWSYFKSDTDLLRLYERWLHTGSEWAERRLAAEGIIPVRSSSKLQ